MDIVRTHKPDAAGLAPRAFLKARTLADGSAQFYALVDVTYDKGTQSVTIEVLLTELTPQERANLKAGYQALHAAAMAKVKAEDFR